MKKPLNFKNQIPVAAHRGVSEFYPENTMAAFRAAKEIPHLDMIETDVHMTKDGHLVLIHDHALDRTTNGKGLVREKTLAEIKELDAGNHKDAKFVGEQVPLLSELFDLFKDDDDMLFNIELKDYPCDSGDFAYESCDKIIAMIKEYGLLDRCVVNSWNGVLNEYVDEKYGDIIRIHGYYPEYLGAGQKRLVYDYAYCICLFQIGSEMFPAIWYDFCKLYNVEPWACFAVNNPEYFEKAMANGARLFTVNDPVWLIDYLRSKGLHK